MFASCWGVLGCAAPEYVRQYPDASPEEVTFIRFLQEDGYVTPTQIQRYLAANGLQGVVAQDPWEGIDRWKITELGTWTARYTGQKKELDGKTFIIPGDIDGILGGRTSSSDPISIKDPTMHYYYDSICQDSRGYQIFYDRADDTTNTQNKAMMTTPDRSLVGFRFR